MRRSVRDSFLPALLLAVLAAGCGSDGAPPPPARLYFPIALNLSDDFDMDGAGDFLVVANSNFDLRYNSGSLQAYDLSQVNDALDERCGDVDPIDEDCGIIPIEDNRDDLGANITPIPNLVASEVLVGSFADGLAYAPSGTGARVYLPIRSEGDLSYVDLSSEGVLSCGASQDSTAIAPGIRHQCVDTFRGAEAGASNEDGLLVPPDPVAAAVGTRASRIPGAEGNYIVMAHRGGRMSLFWETATGARPQIVDTIEGLPNELVEIAEDPVDGSLWVATAFDPVVPRVGIALGQTAGDSFLFRASDLAVTGIDTGDASLGDTRQVRFDPRPDVRRAYVLARRPRAVLSVDVDGSVGALDVRAQIPVGAGPSRMEVTHFDDLDGDQDPSTGPSFTLAFVTCFDSRDLYVIDLDAERLVGIVRSLGGPFELAVDEARKRVYVGDFRSSVLRVLDLEPTFDCLTDEDYDGSDDEPECSPTQLGFVGRPRAVQELI
jgi:hypothetical protein